MWCCWLYQSCKHGPKVLYPAIWLVNICTNITSDFVEDLKAALTVTIRLKLPLTASNVTSWSLPCSLPVSSSKKPSWQKLLMVFCAAASRWERLRHFWLAAASRKLWDFKFFFFSLMMMSTSVLFSHPMESTHFTVSVSAVTASSRGASIVLLKLRALKQRGRDLVMTVWMSCQALGDQRVSLMFSSLMVLRPLLPEPCRRVCADP